jgi:hypothetical protein
MLRPGRRQRRRAVRHAEAVQRLVAGEAKAAVEAEVKVRQQRQVPPAARRPHRLRPDAAQKVAAQKAGADAVAAVALRKVLRFRS